MDKNCFHAIFIHDFSYEKSQVALQRDDAPSVALLVLERWGKMPRSLAGHGVPDTVNQGLCSKKRKERIF
ncbi:MAG TPA: hypothetical protein DCP61_01365 [Treponema sp.]|nr:hypothetical protein [Treponema sp.]